jgi:DNA-binding transcriptional regulator YiaG
MTPLTIKTLREKHRLTRQEFGALVYQTERAVKGWECGERKMGEALWELLQYKLEGVEPPKHVWHNENQGKLL